MTSDPTDAHPAESTELAETEAEVDALVERLRPLLRPDAEKKLRAVLVNVSERHAGPLPSAQQLEQYDRTLPGAADRILAMAEREQQHRHAVDRDLVSKEFTLQARGQGIALVALVLLLALIAYIASTGASDAAAWLGSVTIVGVILAFTAPKLAASLARGKTPDSPQSEQPERPTLRSE